MFCLFVFFVFFPHLQIEKRAIHSSARINYHWDKQKISILHLCVRDRN